MKIINKQISVEINNLMKGLGLNARSLSQLSGVSERTINKILNSEICPSKNTLMKICNVFCINICQFFDLIISNEFFKSELLA